MNPIVILGFDMETDIGSWTPFYEGLTKGTPRILNVLSKHNVKATFFFVGEAARLHPEVLRMVSGAGHEVGCHTLYHETIGDEIIPIPGLRPILPEECYHRIEVATDVVQQVLGAKVTSFRAPRLWGSTAMVNALEDLGFTADASYPMYFFKDRLVPYHPSRSDWTAEGDMNIIEIPNFADMTIDSTDVCGRDRDAWPIYRSEGAGSLIKHVDNMVSFYQKKNLPAVVSLYFHPWEFHEMPEGLIHFGEGAVLPDPFIIKNSGQVAVNELDDLIAMMKDRKAEFAMVKDITDCGIRKNEE